MTSPDQPMSDNTRKLLKESRNRLLRLHKVLLDRERANYEKEHGRVDRSHDLLQLVINHEQFAWLHALSELVVRVDEMLDMDEPITESDGTALLDEVRQLLKPTEEGTGFGKKYYDAMQDDPNIVLAHADIVKLLATKP
ncbi:MAG: hypothetical protein QOH96_4059 [Blastocatellia bacterium]|jgi:ligand-binding sensor domain-containing protein|nr:hypothetical protein [Blastocatellia bacterium]